MQTHEVSLMVKKVWQAPKVEKLSVKAMTRGNGGFDFDGCAGSDTEFDCS